MVASGDGCGICLRHADLAALDGDGGGASAVGNARDLAGFVVIGDVAHRSQGAATIYIMVDLTAVHHHVGVAIHTSCRQADGGVGAGIGAAFHASSAAINVAAVQVLTGGSVVRVGFHHLRCGELGADGAAVNGHQGVGLHVAVTAAAEHRAYNVGRAVNGHLGVVDEGHVAPVLACHTTARAIHVAGVGTALADVACRGDDAYLGSAVDGDLGQAGAFGEGQNAFHFGVGTHVGQRAAAIHVVIHGAAAHEHVGVAVHASCGMAEGSRQVGVVDASTAAV